MICFLVEYRSDGTSIRQKWILEEHKKYTIGRNQDKVSILLPHLSVSRIHAVLIIYADNILKIKDLNTVNGTFVNDKKLPPDVEVQITSSDFIFFAENPNGFKVFPGSAFPLEDVNVKLGKILHDPTPLEGCSHNETPEAEIDYHELSKHVSNNCKKYDFNNSIIGYDYKSEAKSNNNNPGKKKWNSNQEFDSSSSASADRTKPQLYSNMCLILNNSNSDNRNSSNFSDGSTHNKATAHPVRTTTFKSKWDTDLLSSVTSPTSISHVSNLSIGKSDSSTSSNNVVDDNNNMNIDKLTKMLKEKVREQVMKMEISHVSSVSQNSLTSSDAQDDPNKLFSNSTGEALKKKHKLLWSRKNTNSSDENKSGVEMKMDCDVELPITSTCLPCNGESNVDYDPNLYGASFKGDGAKKIKFLKLMGHKNTVTNLSDSTQAPSSCSHNIKCDADVDNASLNENNDTSFHSSVDGMVDDDVCHIEQNGKVCWKSLDHLDAHKNAQREKELEMQFYRGIKRLDGRKTGLGL